MWLQNCLCWICFFFHCRFSWLNIINNALNTNSSLNHCPKNYKKTQLSERSGRVLFSWMTMRCTCTVWEQWGAALNQWPHPVCCPLPSHSGQRENILLSGSIPLSSSTPQTGLEPLWNPYENEVHLIVLNVHLNWLILTDKSTLFIFIYSDDILFKKYLFIIYLFNLPLIVVCLFDCCVLYV